ncbi:dihydroxyacetone kinase family protein [Marmoricola endophyticus]|uniref:Dihydroxyacetone kinase family protein n=1 Tax=Marmoricola endophyticus TaxID=2040280 RepID=A0A917BGY9_9ACTN|nr:dihydroxyacetone kinase subunit DhaK [Marmoricola endophyticus]GGF41993.1 dihydroxyacetone kinase family protein [Marmoricola endophyticus]
MTRSFLARDRSPSSYALEGVALTSGGTTATSVEPAYAWATDPDPGRVVALVSGGGAGHEPMHAGFVGRGGLDAAVPGEVFTSPHNGQLYAAGREVARAGGVLHVVKNYTGDRINFHIAAERLRAEGIEVEEVVVDDDLGSDDAEVGRRGTGATVVVEKVLGAAADTGADLTTLAALGRRVVERSRTLAVASGAHHAPGDGNPAFTLDDGELEYGVGIHGERAASTATDEGLDVLVERMAGALHEALPVGQDGVLVLVNGLGAVSNLELLHVAGLAHAALTDRGVRVRCVTAGTFVSALDMRGFSLTLTAAEEDWLQHWYAGHATTGLPRPVPLGEVTRREPDPGTGSAGSSPWLGALAERFAQLRPALDRLDQHAGDGDLGTNLAGGTAAAARAGVAGDLPADLRVLADAFLDSVGGSSGPLFGLVLRHAAAALAQDGDDPARALADGLRAGLDAVREAGGAEIGDRTLLDALGPASYDKDRPRRHLDAAAVSAALEGARRTSDLRARRGRASYLGDRALGRPDPGAVGLAALLLALHEAVTGAEDAALRADLDGLLREE